MKRELAAALTATTILSGMVGHVNAKTRYVTLLVGQGFRDPGFKSDNVRENITYDKYGLLIKENFKGTVGTYSFGFVYDSHHHIRKRMQSGGAGKEYVFSTYKTNKDGMVIYEKIIHEKGTVYTYNKSNQIIKEKSKDKASYLYKYNKKGQLIAEGTSKQLKKNQGYYYQYNKYGYEVRSNNDHFKTKKNDSISKYKYTKDHRVKQVKSYSGDPSSADIWMNTYRYKKIKINTKYLKQVRYQQDALTQKNGHFVPYIYNT